MFKRVLKDGIACGLDIGSQNIKVALVKIEKGKQKEILAVDENRTFGFNDVSVSDLGEFSDCIHQTIDKAVKKAKVKPNLVNLGLGGDVIDIRQTKSIVPLMEKEGKIISRRDIKEVRKNARLIGMKLEEEVLHDLPEYFIVDDDNLAVNPLGLYGRKLAVSSLLVVTKVNTIRNIIRAVNNAGYEVAGVFFNTLSAADIVLSDEEKQEGCILVDIGSYTTTILLYKDRILKYISKIKAGGDSFTRKISDAFGLSYDLAEEIKKSYAVALSSDIYSREEILIKRESNYIPIKREDIYKTIESEIELLLNSIKNELESSNLLGFINRDIKFIGGGSLFPGLIERIGFLLKLPVKLPKVSFWTNGNPVKSSLYATVIGLAEDKNKSFQIDPLVSENKQLFEKVADRIKDLYFEYF